MTDKVIFSGIKYKQKSLIWDYDAKSNTAILTFKCAGEDVVQDPNKVSKSLQKKFKEFEVSEGKVIYFPGAVIIKDVALLSKSYPMTKVEVSLNTSSNTPRLSTSNEKIVKQKSEEGSPEIPEVARDNNSPRKSSFFRRNNSESRILRNLSSPRLKSNVSKPEQSPSTPPPVLTSSKEVVHVAVPLNDLNREENLRKDFQSIDIHDLILESKEAGLYRDTISVLSDFQKLTETKYKILSPHLRIEASFSVALQLEKNRSFYDAKAKLMTEVESLFTQLNSVYKIWAKDKDIESRRTLYFYLQTAIKDVVNNTPFNSTPTEFEKLSRADVEDKFKGNQSLFFQSIQMSRAVRAKIMLIKLSYLIDKALLESAVPLSGVDAEIFKASKLRQEVILSFKQVIAENTQIREEIKGKIQLLKTHICNVGGVEQHFNLKNQALLSQLKEPQVDEFFSFQHIIRNYLIDKFSANQKIDSVMSQEVDALSRDACAAVIFRLHALIDTNCSLKQLIPKLPSKEVDKNFYLGKDWTNGVKVVLSEVDLTKLLKNPGKKTLITESLNGIATKVVDYFKQQAEIILQDKTDGNRLDRMNTSASATL